MSDDTQRAATLGFNQGLEAAISVINGGIHSATRMAGLWGTVDDEQIYIAAIRSLRRADGASA